jgi:hypothetical protein
MCSVPNCHNPPRSNSNVLPSSRLYALGMIPFSSLVISLLLIADDCSGSMVPPTPVPLMAFQRRIKVSNSNLCMARSRCTVILTVRRCHLTWLTAPEATLTKRVGWMRPEFEPCPFHRSLGSYSSVHQRRESYLQISFWHRACGPHVMTRCSRQLCHELVHLREVLWTASDMSGTGFDLCGT